MNIYLYIANVLGDIISSVIVTEEFLDKYFNRTFEGIILLGWFFKT